MAYLETRMRVLESETAWQEVPVEGGQPGELVWREITVIKRAEILDIGLMDGDPPHAGYALQILDDPHP